MKGPSTGTFDEEHEVLKTMFEAYWLQDVWFLPTKQKHQQKTSTPKAQKLGCKWKTNAHLLV